MFDKPRCHAHLAAAGIPVPPALSPVRSHEELMDAMRERGWTRVFLKSAHGSSASGVVAYQTDGTRHQAITSAEMVETGTGVKLYNSLRLRIYTAPKQISRLIDELCRHHVHVERWMPKAKQAGKNFDLRVLVIAGRPRHKVARRSRSPMTNLHLLNERGDLDAVRLRMGDEAWARAMETCARTGALFPDSLHAGVDLLISPDLRQHAVLEVNAFGDLLPRLTDDGLNTGEAQVEAVLRGWMPSRTLSDRLPLGTMVS